jgi:hypothetical protein
VLLEGYVIVEIEPEVPLAYSPHYAAAALINQQIFLIEGSVCTADVEDVALGDLLASLVEKVHKAAGGLVSDQKLTDEVFFGAEGLLLCHDDDLDLDVLFGGGQVDYLVRWLASEDEGVDLLKEVLLDFYLSVHYIQINYTPSFLQFIRSFIRPF